MRSRAERRAVRRARRGISLFEAIAALSIVGLVAVSALEAVGAGLRVAADARRAVVAEALSTQRVDALDLLTDAELQSLPDTIASGRFDYPLDEYSWTTQSAVYPDQQGVYDLIVAINWSQGTYAVHTYLYRRPVLATRGGGRGGGN